MRDELAAAPRRHATTAASPSRATASSRASASKSRVAVTLRPTATIDIDFAGTSTQSGGAINASFSQTMSGVIYAVRCLVDPTHPDERGLLPRRAQVHLPPGTLVNPNPPAACGGRVISVTAAIEAMLAGARAGARPTIAVAASALIHVYSLTGIGADGAAWVNLFYDFGGIGGAPRRRRARRHRLLLPRRPLGDPADRAARGAVPVRRPAVAAPARLRRRRAVARRPRHRDRDRAARRRRAHRARRPHRAPAAGRATAATPGARARTSVERVDGTTEVLADQARSACTSRPATAS